MNPSGRIGGRMPAAVLLACTLALVVSTVCAEAQDVRKSALAGSWYPADAAELQKQIDDLLAKANAPQLSGGLRALIVPHAAYQYAGAAAAVGYKCIDGQKFSRVVILGPNHRVPLRGCSVPTYTHFETPLGLVPLDTEACTALRKNSLIGDAREPHKDEHSIEIQLPFLQRTIGQFKLVPVLVGELDARGVKSVAASILPLLDDETLLVVSSDFTHFGPRFGYQPFSTDIQNNLRNLDHRAFSAILDGDSAGLLRYRDETGSTICGILPIAILLDLLGSNTQPMLLVYYTSGDLTNDWTNTVSYAAFCFTDRRDQLNESEQATLLKLSRNTLEMFVREGKVPTLSLQEYNITPAMMRNAGVFVTLRKHGELRGCIGTLTGVSPIVSAVIDNTIKSAASDPRFTAVKPDELKDIDIEISVLTEPQPMNDYRTIRLGVDGVILQKGNRSGVFLPQVATETGWGLDEFMDNLCLKAGLPKGSHLAPGAKIYNFQVQVFAEKR
jgi:AmmeMemoRadiSam system protein B/AmmeMemoRadiSam system protein A